MQNRDSIILSTAYLGPVQYYAKFLAKDVYIEQWDTYIKQTYRNRCRILTGNGVEDYSIPVVKPNGNNTLVKDILLDNSRKWQQQHWRSMVAAYNNSAFFEFYADDFEALYSRYFENLLEWNLALHDLVLECLQVDSDYQLTSSYIHVRENDYREVIHPKKEVLDEDFRLVEYYQLFKDRYGFQPNLSIVDLLFNCGPESLLILQQSCKKA